MAEVFKAKAFGVEGFERLLAVKRILPNIAEDEEFIAMFIDEAKISVQLQHANIAQIFDLGKVEDSFFIALEYVNGKDLRAIFDRTRQRGEVMPISQSAYIVMQVCEGLDYAHNKRDGQGRELHLIHRDISPQNVLIGYEGEIKLIDFGIAKAAGKASKTQAGILKGKFGYMSPEQVRGLPIDRRSDVFAVGIVLYELLTSERLFVGESDFSTLEKVRNVEILPPSSYNRKIPPELERIALKALAKDPEDRYQNAIDLHDDLQAFLYAVGEIYSRKDLSAWMKKNFAIEIEEDNAKLELFRQIAAPAAAQAEMRAEMAPPKRAVAVAAAAPPVRASAAPMSTGVHKDVISPVDMGWDDEELDTQIFDKENSSGPADTAADSAELFFEEDDDRTVAGEPPPDMLRAATAPEHLVTPAPVSEAGRAKAPPAGMSASLAGHTARAVRPTASGRPGLPKSTLVGIPTNNPLGAGAAGIPGVGGSARLSAQRPALPPPSVPQQQSPPGGFTPPGPPGLSSPGIAAPLGEAQRPMRPSRAGLYTAVAAAAVLAIGGSGLWYWWSINRPGSLQLSIVPADATVLVDNVKIGDRSPITFERPPGTYMVSVTREGFLRNDQNVELRAGQQARLAVALEASPDAGFELTSEPPGGLVWFDGVPIKGPTGEQARTDFRAYRIPGGHHVLEIKGENRFKPWRQEINLEAGAIQKVHATLVSALVAEAAKPAPAAHVEVKPDAKPEPRPETVRSAPAPRPRIAAATPTSTSGEPASSGESGAASSSSGNKRRKKAREAVVAEGDEEGPDSAAKGENTEGGDCSITIGSRPWSEVWIDGKNTTKHTPFADYRVPCGKHKLGFKRPDLQIDHTEVISVRAGQRFKQSFALEAEQPE
jgi:eukaryotic-like serine/threonine-protein kinase